MWKPYLSLPRPGGRFAAVRPPGMLIFDSREPRTDTIRDRRPQGPDSQPLLDPAYQNGHGKQPFTVVGAAGLMEVDEFWVMGGAQAVGALAYGTESIGRVDKIVGPGNAWVTAAKLEVLDACAIDMPAGPTEVMVVADESADPAHVAADMLSQAEHGADSPSLLVTPSAALAANTMQVGSPHSRQFDFSKCLNISIALFGLGIRTSLKDIS